jgi:hypothetical protein
LPHVSQEYSVESSPVTANPFGLMMNPQAILEAVERSERLSRLERRICRPLDKPLIPHADGSRSDDADEVPEDFGADTIV